MTKFLGKEFYVDSSSRFLDKVDFDSSVNINQYVTSDVSVLGDVYANDFIVNDVEDVDRTIYIDASTGDDVTGDGTDPSTAFASLEKGILDIKKQINVGVTVTIDLAAGDYTLTEKSVEYLNGLYWYGYIVITGHMKTVLSDVSVTADPSIHGKTNLDSVTWSENQYQGYFVEGYATYQLHPPILYNSTNYYYTSAGNSDGTRNILNTQVNIFMENNCLKKLYNSYANKGVIDYSSLGALNIYYLDLIFSSVDSSQKIIYLKNHSIVIKSCKIRKTNDGNIIQLNTRANNQFMSCIFLSEYESSSDFIYLSLQGLNLSKYTFFGTDFCKQGGQTSIALFYMNGSQVIFGDLGVYNYLGVFMGSSNQIELAEYAFINMNFIFDTSSSLTSHSPDDNNIENINSFFKESSYYYLFVNEGNFTNELPTNWFDTYSTYIDNGRQILGLPGVYPEEDLRNESTLTSDSSTQLTIGHLEQNRSITFDYTLQRNTLFEEGQLRILNANGQLYLTQDYQNAGTSPGVTFESQYDSSLIELNCIVDDSSTSDVSINYDIYRKMIK